jgi:hypothetical protein
MRHAVVEKCGDRSVSVTLHKTAKKAFNYALEIALENTSYTKDQVKEHLDTSDNHEEGDYGVYIVEAQEVK